MRAGHVLAVNVPAKFVDDGDVETGPPVTGAGSLHVDALVVEPTTTWLVDRSTAPTDRFEAIIVVRGELHAPRTMHAAEIASWRQDKYMALILREEPARCTNAKPGWSSKPNLNRPRLAIVAQGRAPRVRRAVAARMNTRQIVHDGDPALMFVVGDEAAPSRPSPTFGSSADP